MVQNLRNYFRFLKRNKEKNNKDTSVSYFELYSFATPLDKISIFFGIVFSACSGAFHPLILSFFGEITGDVISYVTATNSQNLSEPDRRILEDTLYNDVWRFAIKNCIIGVLLTLFRYAAGVLFTYSALRQISKIRYFFFQKTLNQDIGWYDQHQTGDFASILTDNIDKIEDGIGEKVEEVLYYLSCFIISLGLGFARGWKFALVCMVVLPLITISMAVTACISSKYSHKEMKLYGDASSISEEVFSTIRTVIAFDGQEKEMKRYDKHVVDAKNNNVKRWLITAIGQGFMWCLISMCYALTFWYGVRLIVEDRALPENKRVYTPRNILAIYFAIFLGSWYCGCAMPYFEVFGVAKGAAQKVFSVINSAPIINGSKNDGALTHFEEKITFKDVHFHYPSRSDVQVLKGLNLEIKYGEKVALIGNSGCGKSTIIHLIQRFYDPVFGSITIDDVDLKKLNLTDLRKAIGVVSQEPTLFATTIAENIRYGKLDATEDDIKNAAKKANAHKFILSLPNGYNTVIGERGSQISGGQKQRIAIARAVIRKPKILLLDEATSALDIRSEAEVQAALNQIGHECTVIIVAHRLSTIRHADRIIVLSDGCVKEEGNHQELIKKRGIYYNLVNSQGFTEVPGKGDIKDYRAVSVSNKSEQISENDELEETQEEAITKNRNTLGKILSINKPEWYALFFGCIGSIVDGATAPVNALVLGCIANVLANPNSKSLIESTNMYCVYYVIIGIVNGLAVFLHTFQFGFAGEKLTMRIRKKMFEAMLAQEVAWFDRKENGVGALCAQLSGDAANVQRAGGHPIGLILRFLSMVLISCIFSLILEWRLALVLLAFCPVLYLAIYAERKAIAGDTKKAQRELEKSAKLAVEAVGNIRTVAALGCEEVFCQSYIRELQPSLKTAKRKSHLRAFVMGCAKSTLAFAYGACMWYGVHLIINNGVNHGLVFQVIHIVLSSSWAIGNTLLFVPNLQKGWIAANRVFKLLERVPKIRNVAHPIESEGKKSNVEYSRVYFSYPTRPAVSVLNGLDLSVTEGKTVALVGSSGCGKSTCIQLLERFYDPVHGKVSVGDDDIKTMDLKNLRSHLGIVSQEPNLFNKTIAENISYGANHRDVSMDEIVQAAKSANIHNFIVNLPKGYETSLGSKGTQLSGGQKQRIAIARALIRNPKVLLLDEATSALDNESEKVVQEALDNAKKDRTCITIAHRLTTIQDADLICVIKEGIVAEMGTHTELLQRKGLYYRFYKLQSE